MLVATGEKASRIVSDLSSFPWHKYIKGIEFLGVSAGCAAYPRDGRELEGLVHTADSAMYMNKRAGLQAASS